MGLCSLFGFEACCFVVYWRYTSTKGRFAACSFAFLVAVAAAATTATLSSYYRMEQLIGCCSFKLGVELDCSATKLQVEQHTGAVLCYQEPLCYL